MMEEFLDAEGVLRLLRQNASSAERKVRKWVREYDLPVCILPNHEYVFVRSQVVEWAKKRTKVYVQRLAAGMPA